MDFHQDFADLCSLLNAKAVDFLIVGGYAGVRDINVDDQAAPDRDSQ